MPRRYRSRKREEGVRETRRRILEATMQLHAERGVVATSWEDIARRSGISLATVYRHFPSLDELVPACGALAEQFTRPPVPERAGPLFEGVEELPERVRRLVEELCAFYERAGDALLLARREGHLVEPLAAWAGGLDRTRGVLVRAALRPAGSDERTERVVDALVSFPVWRALAEAGVPAAETRGVILGLVTSVLRGTPP